MFAAILFSVVTFEARSAHYAISIENAPVSGKVVVTDLDSNSRVISEEVMWVPGQPSKIDRTIGDLHFKLSVSRIVDVLKASLEVDRGDVDIDEIHSSFRIAPRNVPPPAPAGVLPVGGEVHAPQLLHRVEPVYPADARMNKVSGIVVVRAVIDTAGKVTEAAALQGPPELAAAAVDAVRQWTFQPATKGGQAVPVMFNVTINFKLN